MNASKYVYVMRGLGMTYAGGRDVLNDITLAFLPGAKIGVLGLNGAGKSTLLRIMAGLETEYRGDAWAAESIRVGHLAQEPALDPSRTVLDNVLEGIADTRDLLARFEAVSARFAEPLDDEAMNALIEEQSALQERIDAADAWDIDRKVEIAMDALRCPPGEADVLTLSGGERRRVALCRLLLGQPDLLLLDERLQASRLLKRVAAGGQAEDQQRVVKADRPDQPAAVVSVLIRLDINHVIPNGGNKGGFEIAGRGDQGIAGKRFRQDGMKKGVTIG